MLEHEADQVIVAPLRITQAEFGIGRAFLAQHVPDRHAHRRDQRLERGAVGRRFQVLDDGRFLAAVADQAQHVARGAAGWVVVDRDGAHGCLLEVTKWSRGVRTSRVSD
jgi:hypothetical protein